LHGSVEYPDVDHFFPHMLKRHIGSAIDPVLNLLLACRTCNRRSGGRFERPPSLRLLALVHSRNEYLKPSLTSGDADAAAGKTEALRRSFLMISINAPQAYFSY
jgi:hypothetical protein